MGKDQRKSLFVLNRLSAHHIIMGNTCTKFDQNTLNSLLSIMIKFAKYGLDLWPLQLKGS